MKGRNSSHAWARKWPSAAAHKLEVTSVVNVWEGREWRVVVKCSRHKHSFVFLNLNFQVVERTIINRDIQYKPDQKNELQPIIQGI